jgi:TonB family protein
MATSAQAGGGLAGGGLTAGWNGPSRRRVPRYHLHAPLDVTVLRSGVPDTMPGRSVNFCESGIAAMLAGELTPGEAVGIEVQLPLVADPLRTRATVRYQDKLRCGLEFVGLSPEQRAAIRDWVRESKAELEVGVAANPNRAAATETSVDARKDSREKERHNRDVRDRDFHDRGSRDGGGGSSRNRSPQPKQRGAGWILLVLLAAISVAVFWWKWNRAWDELESGLKTEKAVAVEQPQVEVPAEVMEKLLVHRVEPVYPADARRERLEGVIALDVVVGRDGSVVDMHPLNGPDVLARAAMDALRWWKFEPYRVNGEPAIVATRVAVEFKR